MWSHVCASSAWPNYAPRCPKRGSIVSGADQNENHCCIKMRILPSGCSLRWHPCRTRGLTLAVRSQDKALRKRNLSGEPDRGLSSSTSPSVPTRALGLFCWLDELSQPLWKKAAKGGQPNGLSRTRWKHVPSPCATQGLCKRQKPGVRGVRLDVKNA